MPSKRKQSEGAVSVSEVTIPPELLDQVVNGLMTADDVQAVCRSHKKALVEPAIGAGISQHLGCASGDAKPAGQANL